MRGIIRTVMIAVIILLSACHVFLGTEPGKNPEEILESIWKDFDETYGPMGVREEKLNFSWNQVYNDCKEELKSSGWKSSDERFFRLCGNMLKVLQDGHVSLYSLYYYSISYSRGDFEFDSVKPYLINSGASAGDGYFLHGTFKTNPHIGYIQIQAFDHGNSNIDLRIADWARDIDSIIPSLEKADAIVLDLRGNTGGFDSNMEYIASRFVSSERNYIKTKTKTGPGRNDFSSAEISTIKPDGPKRYTKPIVLLTNKQTASAGEWFTLAVRTQDHVTHIGTPTNGILSTYVVRPLPNGWHYTISVQKVEAMNGECYEGSGIPPYMEIETNQLEEAINLAVDMAAKVN
jgi:hypothetical protein